jgi:hypothetical protein
MKPPVNLYTERTIQWLNAYEENLWFNLERVPQLGPEVGKAVLSGFLEQACQAQHIGNIEIGRYGIQAIPREWVLQHIEDLAESLLQTEDEWEYRRLLEVYYSLDKTLARKLALRAISNLNPDIKEAGKDFLEQLNREAAYR